jgi:hypothetical protein
MIGERRTEVETGNGTGQEQHILAFLPVPMKFVPNLEEASGTLPPENVLRTTDDPDGLETPGVPPVRIPILHIGAPIVVYS